MRKNVRRRAWSHCCGAALALFAAAYAPRDALSQEIFAIDLVTPGMNQTELTSVMGPPTYIQVKNLRQAWQYCPPRSFRRFVGDLLRFETEPPLFVTVWFNEGRVEHMRAYPSRVMGRCEDFLAAFRWEDVIEGGDAFAGGYALK